MFDDGVLKIEIPVPPSRRGAAKAIIQWMCEGSTVEFHPDTVTIFRRPGSFVPHSAAYDDPLVKEDTPLAVDLERRLREMILDSPEKHLRRSA